MPGQAEPQLVNTTNRDYDLAEMSKQLRQVLLGIAMMAFLHGYMQYTQPLFIQGVMPLKNVWDQPVCLLLFISYNDQECSVIHVIYKQMIKIHLLGKPAVGDLKRPFKSGGGFMGEYYSNKIFLSRS